MELILTPFVVIGFLAKILNRKLIQNYTDNSVHAKSNHKLETLVNLVCDNIDTVNKRSFYLYDNQEYQKAETA
jgi:phage-related holin